MLGATETSERKYADTCADCGPLQVVSRDGLWLCEKCGADLGAIVETKPARSDYIRGAPYNDTSNILFKESALSTRLAYTRGSESQSLAKYSRQFVPQDERSLKTKCHQLNDCVGKQIPSQIVDRAKLIYREVITLQKKYSKTPISRGKNSTGILAACLVAALGEFNQSRSDKQIAKMFSIETSYLTHGKHIVFKMLNQEGIYVPRLRDWKDSLHACCANVGLEDSVTRDVERIIRIIYKKGLANNHTQNSIIAGTIRFVTKIHGLNLSKERISEECNGLSTNTIDRVYDKLMDNICAFFTV